MSLDVPRAPRLVGDAVREVRRTDGAALRDEQGRACRILHSRRSDRQGAPAHLPNLRGRQFHRGNRRQPFLQIGEHKYGKPILDRVARPEMRLGEAAKLILLSFDSDAAPNLSVGMPLDILIYASAIASMRKREKRIDKDDEYFKKLSSAWSDVSERHSRISRNSRSSWVPRGRPFTRVRPQSTMVSLGRPRFTFRPVGPETTVVSACGTMSGRRLP